MPEYVGGRVTGVGGPTDDSIPAALKGCTVHGKPHPRACDEDCDGEWVISASAVRSMSAAVRDELRELNRRARRTA